MGKQARWGMAAVSVLGAFSLAACAHQEPVPVHAPVEERLPASEVEQPAAPPAQASPPPKADHEKTAVTKTWLSQEEVEAARGAEQQHTQESQSFWAMRKDRESLRPNIRPGGTCVCFGGDPLCSCR